MRNRKIESLKQLRDYKKELHVDETFKVVEQMYKDYANDAGGIADGTTNSDVLFNKQYTINDAGDTMSMKDVIVSRNLYFRSLQFAVDDGKISKKVLDKEVKKYEVKSKKEIKLDNLAVESLYKKVVENPNISELDKLIKVSSIASFQHDFADLAMTMSNGYNNQMEKDCPIYAYPMDCGLNNLSFVNCMEYMSETRQKLGSPNIDPFITCSSDAVKSDLTELRLNVFKLEKTELDRVNRLSPKEREYERMIMSNASSSVNEQNKSPEEIKKLKEKKLTLMFPTAFELDEIKEVRNQLKNSLKDVKNEFKQNLKKAKFFSKERADLKKQFADAKIVFDNEYRKAYSNVINKRIAKKAELDAIQNKMQNGRDDINAFFGVQSQYALLRKATQQPTQQQPARQQEANFATKEVLNAVNTQLDSSLEKSNQK
ncbi:MAG: hypothetical protein Ta2D_05600 [Rickettsiales bacterium]|nr:MAG: hypothetical protein Ta2D_05600 [Rickettsiales bacterium]